MTEVTKVSIGGYAFTLDVNAYDIVKQYLSELETYYAPQEGGAEVMEGFEERMAELLYEKCADDGVASAADVQEIIGVLGKPSAIESESDAESGSEAAASAGKEKGDEKNRKKERRKLYRDPTNRQVAGVCSGLAAFFKCDVVLIRLIAIGLFLLTVLPLGCSLGGDGAWFVMPLTYIVLWIAMPEARTVRQRWEMGIANPPAGAAAANAAAPAGRPAGSGLGRALRIIFGCLLLLFAVAGLTFAVAAVCSPSIFGWDMTRSVRSELSVHAPGIMPLATSVLYIIAVALTCLLPFVGMLYGAIMLLFDLRTPRWRPGLVLFIVWVIALTVFTVLTGMSLFYGIFG